jgi:hypothetical protein
LKPEFLKGAQENQVERNILIGTVEAASHSTYGTQRTMEEFHPRVCQCRKQFVAQVGDVQRVSVTVLQVDYPF